MIALRIIDRPTIKVQWQVELCAFWVGVFWRRTEIALHICVCIVPLLPLHITIAIGEARAAIVGED